MQIFDYSESTEYTFSAFTVVKYLHWYEVSVLLYGCVNVVCVSLSFFASVCITHVCRPWSAGRSQRGRNLSRKRTRPLVPGATSCEEDIWCSRHLWLRLCRYHVCTLG